MTFERVTRITAPYNFVPLSPSVIWPDWIQPREGVAPPIHDVPFEDGLCGTLEVEVTAETPIFTRGSGKDTSQPFQLPGGSYAIPGTALRGALRNVVEIATFGHFNRVNNHRYAVRDLQNRNLYGQYMADIVKDPKTGKSEPMPLINAGWLSREKGKDGEWVYSIDVQDFAKIEYQNLEELARQRNVKGFQPGNKQSSVDKYRIWANASLQTDVSVRWRRPDRVGSRVMHSQYGSATLEAATAPGTIVFTGQPSKWMPDPVGKRAGAGNAKHHDFVFFKRQDPRKLSVSKKTFEDFEFAHSDRGQQNNLGKSQTPNTEWGYWSKHMENERPVPVFFLTDQDGTVKTFGLAMMFRLSYQHSIHEAIKNVSADHVTQAQRFDFADALFGAVLSSGSDRDQRRSTALALKGRVGISHAIETRGARTGPPVEAILGAPKASYYPNYVEQDPNPKYVQAYRTWMDKTGAPRGWKRYRTMTETWKPPVPTGGDGRQLDLSKVGTRFHPLPAGTSFSAHLDVHNLRPAELGALLWALDFGGDAEARHSLGMARPLGYGRVRMSLSKSSIQTMDGESADLARCKEAFENYMEEQLKAKGGWRSSPQLRELLAIAHPVPPPDAVYQRLDPGRRINEFVDAKRAGLSLPRASGASTVRTDSPASQSKGTAPVPRTVTPTSIPGTVPRGVSSWPGRNKGDVILVELTGLNKKGKWRCTVVDYPGTIGTLNGSPAPDAALGQRYSAIVAVGNDPTSLQFNWKP